MKNIRVFLVDDHYVVCEGIRRMLEQEEDLSVVGEKPKAVKKRWLNSKIPQQTWSCWM